MVVSNDDATTGVVEERNEYKKTRTLKKYQSARQIHGISRPKKQRVTIADIFIELGVMQVMMMMCRHTWWWCRQLLSLLLMMTHPMMIVTSATCTMTSTHRHKHTIIPRWCGCHRHKLVSTTIHGCRCCC